jgi:hypothetical protein
MKNRVGTNGDFFISKWPFCTPFLCFYELLYTIFNTVFGYILLTPKMVKEE